MRLAAHPPTRPCPTRPPRWQELLSLDGIVIKLAKYVLVLVMFIHSAGCLAALQAFLQRNTPGSFFNRTNFVSPPGDPPALINRGPFVQVPGRGRCGDASQQGGLSCRRGAEA